MRDNHRQKTECTRAFHARRCHGTDTQHDLKKRAQQWFGGTDVKMSEDQRQRLRPAVIMALETMQFFLGNVF